MSAESGKLRISKAVIRKIIGGRAGVKISDEAAGKIAEVLEEKAEKIARHAVSHAKRRNRSIVLLEDVEDYKLTGED